MGSDKQFSSSSWLKLFLSLKNINCNPSSPSKVLQMIFFFKASLGPWGNNPYVSGHQWIQRHLRVKKIQRPWNKQLLISSRNLRVFYQRDAGNILTRLLYTAILWATVIRSGNLNLLTHEQQRGPNCFRGFIISFLISPEPDPMVVSRTQNSLSNLWVAHAGLFVCIFNSTTET